MPAITFKAPADYTQAEYSKLLNDWESEHPRSQDRKDIAVVGAGMSGLLCAWLLQRAGHRVRIYEANNIPGGRVKTLRDGFTNGLYAEAGAMRIPVKHSLTLHLVQRFGLSTWNFKNSCDQTFLHFGNRKTPRTRVKAEKLGPLGMFGLGKDDSAYEQPADQIFLLCLNNFIRRKCELPDDFTVDEIRENSSTPEDLTKYHRIRAALDALSLREFLKDEAYLTREKKPETKLSAAAQDFVVLIENLESLLSTSMTAVLDDLLALGSHEYKQIAGGMDLLPRRLSEELAGITEYNQRIVAADTNDKLRTDRVYVELENRATGNKSIRKFDLIVYAIPFTGLRHIKTNGFTDFAKNRAIRQLHYDNACKVILEFSEPFWEEEKITGGSTITDFPIRRIVYPIREQHEGKHGHCVLLASYTWGADSLRWSALKPHDRVRHALSDVAQVHGTTYEELAPKCVGGMSHTWDQDEFASGAFALFEPYQLGDLFTDVWRPSGMSHYCGEHTSLKHGWIEGAVESAIRCATEICARIAADPGLIEKHEASKGPEFV